MPPLHASLAPSDLLRALRWRYSVKRFDPTKKIPADVWAALEESLVLTPSSFGLQPWRFTVITDQAIKDQLLPLSWQQKQVAEASHVVVFSIRKGLNAGDVGRYLERVAEVRGVPLDSLVGYKKVILRFIERPPDGLSLDYWAELQVYIALGNFMTAAAVLGVDTCPMEGFMPDKYDEVLGLPAEGYAAKVVCVAGYRSDEDKYASIPKVRYPAADVIKHI